jgi:hypothetical protein
MVLGTCGRVTIHDNAVLKTKQFLNWIAKKEERKKEENVVKRTQLSRSK